MEKNTSKTERARTSRKEPDQSRKSKMRQGGSMHLGRLQTSKKSKERSGANRVRKDQEDAERPKEAQEDIKKPKKN